MMQEVWRRFSASHSMIDLREKDRAAICQIARQVFEPGVELWAYGSRVKGTNYDASDLDLAVVAPEGKELDLERLVEFKEALQTSNIPIFVQALDWQRIPESFKKNILQRYEVLVRVGDGGSG